MKSTEQAATSPAAEAPWDPMVTPGEDLAAALHDHHERIAQMLGNVAGSSGDDRRAVFWWLRRFLATHQAAEHVFIRSPALLLMQDEDVAAESRLDDVAFAEVVARLEGAEVDSAEFDQLLEELRRSVGKHARAEELEDLPRVIDVSTPHDVERMRQALDHVDVLVSHRNGPLGERVRPFAELLESATAEFQALHAE